MIDYIDAPELLGCETLQAYRLARPHPSRHTFLRAVRARILNR